MFLRLGWLDVRTHNGVHDAWDGLVIFVIDDCILYSTPVSGSSAPRNPLQIITPTNSIPLLLTQYIHIYIKKTKQHQKMLPPHTVVALATFLTTISATSITFQNMGSANICYMAELSSGTFPSPTTCAQGTGIAVSAGQTTTVPLSPTFNGALTAWTNNVRGARYEINFAATAGSTWYDADYQLGMSSGTVGPSDNRKLSTGQSSLSGEPDVLAKANAAWPHTANQAALLAFPNYLKQGPNGQLSFVYCDTDAPQVVIDFFQVTAEFDAYIDAGSVAGVTPSAADAEAVRMADAQSLQVDTQDMSIIAH